VIQSQGVNGNQVAAGLKVVETFQVGNKLEVPFEGGGGEASLQLLQPSPRHQERSHTDYMLLEAPLTPGNNLSPH